MTWRLDPRCEFGVAAEPGGDAHEDLGDGLQGPASRALRKALDPLRKKMKALGEAKSLARYEELVTWGEQQPAYEALCTSKVIAGRRQLKSDVLWGGHKRLTPRVLRVRHAASGDSYRALEHDVGKDGWPRTHELVAGISRGISDAALKKWKADPSLGSLVTDLLEAQWIRDDVPEEAPSEVLDEGIWFVGHNSVLVSSGKTRVLVDPWFRPWRDADPEDFRPIRAADVGAPDAVIITHSHGDHFHLGSLLALPRETLIVVPHVEKESLLATDLARQLGELGFPHVRAMRWWETLQVGDVTLEALPFYGEQPSAIDVIDRDLRNVGNTWVVRTKKLSAAFLADTGRDVLGSMHDVALRVRRTTGPVDMVFGGMRGFALRPLFLPFTTLDAMFVNVPMDLLPVKQRLMHDASDLLVAAELFGARWVVPYADGGAPWYWREGMGPTYAAYPSYPGEREAPGRDEEDPASAPFPENLEEEATRRYPGDPLVEPLVLRPGDLVRVTKGKLQVGGVEGFAWPWDE